MKRMKEGNLMSQEYHVKKALKEQKKLKLPGNLYYWTQTKFAYNSNHIEGSRLTEEQTRMIYETKTLLSENDEAVRVDDIIKTSNHFRLLDYVIDHCDDDLDIPMMHTFHQILKMGGSDSSLGWFAVGGWKKLVNVIGDGIETVPPEKVETEIEKLLIQYHRKESISIHDIIDFHYKFESIHPYQDGNGRVGRMIMFKECLKHNIVPFIIEDIHKNFYYRGLKNYREDQTYLVDTCLHAQDNYKAYYDKMIGQLYRQN